jgi:NADH:ubiquinone oxidoreductase subunit F (NADH-binding)/(2Fe-2S) ferredoxin
MKITRNHILFVIDTDSIISGVYSIMDEFKKELETRGLSDEIKILETGNLGITGKGVTLVVYPEGIYYVNIQKDDVKRIVEEHLLKGRPVKDLVLKIEVPFRGTTLERIGPGRKQVRIVLENSGIIDPENIEEYIGRGGYKALETVLTSMKSEDVIEEIKKSKLRGRGGAGFPTGLKWESARKSFGEEKYLICNADEGEPGTFKDRLILEGDPHKLLEGMIIAGYAMSAQKGYIYIRGEYALSIERFNKAIKDAKKYGLLGNNILDSGFSFNIEMKKGAGAYICGEETALIESLEGKRGQPRLKPPYPTVVGLFGKPTVVNNVETLANIAPIIKNGGNWFKSFGTATCPGTKVYTILGHVTFPGLLEVPMGITLKEIIFGYGGGIKDQKKIKAALVGGAAGVFLPENLLDVEMDFDNLKEYKAVLGSGAILVMDEDTDISDMLQSIIEFFNHESCGKCAPCRVGCKELLTIIKNIRKGKGKKEDLTKMISLSEMMFSTSLCPLGQSLILPIKSAIENFRSDFEQKMI